MTNIPSLVRFSSPSGEDRYSLGHPLLDRYLEFVAGRARPNTLRAAAFDLKTFFSVIDKDPADVVATDVFDFLAQQRGDRKVVRMADREVGRVGANAGPAAVVAFGAVRVFDGPRRHGSSVQPGASGSSDSQRRPSSYGPAGAGAAHAAQDLGSKRGRRSDVVASPAPGPGHGAGHAARRGCVAARCSAYASKMCRLVTGRCLSTRVRAATSAWCRSRTRFLPRSATTCGPSGPKTQARTGSSWC